mgnify:CR=1 FL=1
MIALWYTMWVFLQATFWDKDTIDHMMYHARCVISEDKQENAPLEKLTTREKRGMDMT